MLRSSIDLGTNTCLLLIADCDPKGNVLRVVEDVSTIVRLGQGVDQNRRFHPDAMKRTIDCLKGYSERVRAHGLSPAETVAVATASARDVTNSEDFFSQVQAVSGFRFQTISGDREAECSFDGALLPGMDGQRWAVIDIGGGSTELRTSRSGQSLNIGSVRMTERYLKSDPVTDTEYDACLRAVDEALGALQDWRSTLSEGTELLGVAGTVVTLACWKAGLSEFDPDAIHRLTLTREQVGEQVQELRLRSVSERKTLTGIEPARADVLLAGAMILWRSMVVLDFPRLRVSTRGLRFGVLRR